MSTTIYVLDTSYLIELFGCGRDSSPVASKKIRAMFKKINGTGGRFFVPLACVFELGDHIADVGRDDLRLELAQLLAVSVQSSLKSHKPWIITPTGDPESVMPALMARFSPTAAKQQIGLVDCFTWQEADRLKASLYKIKARVHIWTNDRALKAKEPDAENGAYLW